MITKDIKIKVLQGALEVLNGGRNWMKGSYQSAEKFCLAGAVFESARRQGFVSARRISDTYDSWTEYEDTLFGQTASELGSIADEYTKRLSLAELAKAKGYDHVPDFNDASETTYDDIEGLVKERIEMIERQETDAGTNNTA